MLGLLFGALGTLAGLSGALTFVPYHVQNHQSVATGEVLAVVAGVGAVVSIVGVVSSYWILRHQGWAAAVELIVALVSFLVVGVFAALMPPTTPSPVPGGVGIGYLVPVVAVAYGLVAVLLLLSREPRSLLGKAGALPA